MTRFALAAAAAVALCLPGAALAQEGKRYAVLVGVNGYDHPKLEALKYAVNDAAELGEVLGKSGYTVTVLTDDAGKKDRKLAPTKANIEGQLKAVLEKAQKGDLVLVGLAGHGLQFEGDADAYFCPSDGRPQKDKADTLVSLKKVYGELNGSFAGMKVLLVDACRDDPNAGRGSRGIGADTAPPPPKGVAAIFSCKAGQRAFEVEKYRHGVFFYHVLTGLRGEAADKKGRITFAGLAAHVGQEVPSDVSRLVGGGAVQTPNLKADYTSEPVLLAKAGGVAAVSMAEALAADLRMYDRALERGGGAGIIDVLDTRAGPTGATWRKAAEDGNPTGQVLFALCLSYGAGGVTKDEKKGIELFRKAAAAGHPRGMTELGLSYLAGIGVAKDEKEAVKWFRKAADAGDFLGMTMLGSRYGQGQGVTKNETEAVRWYRKAAEGGCSAAANNLGLYYLTGRGVAEDWNEATKWFRRAVEAGHPQGMCFFGSMHETGRGGLKQDLTEAVKWYSKAAELGDELAKEQLTRILGKK